MAARRFLAESLPTLLATTCAIDHGQKGTTVTVTFRQYRTFLTTYLASQRPRLILLAVLLFASTTLQVLSPQILRFFIDAAQHGRSVRVLLGAATLFMAATLLQQMLSVADSATSQYVGWSTTNALREHLMGHVLRLPMSFHTAHTSGELIERIDGDVTLLANFFSTFVIQVLGSSVLLIGVIIALFHVSWFIGSAMLLFALGTLGLLARLRGIAREDWVAGRQSSAELVGFVEERLSGREDIRSNDAVPFSMTQLEGIMRTLQINYRRANMRGHITAVVTQGSLTVGLVLGIGIGVDLYIHGAISLGAVYMTSYYGYILAQPLGLLANQIGDFQQASASLGRIASILAETGEDGASGTLCMPDTAPSIGFHHVTFGYQADQPVVRDLTFEIPSGLTLGILGRTGSGKTTISRLLFRLYDPQQGVVTVSSTPLRKFRLPDLRSRTGLVTQDVDLFDASVRDNLTLFDENISDDLILHAIEDLGLLEWYQRLPEGLETRLRGSSTLSSGEAQLLALIRVFLKNPTVVILDEASSRLDPATERLLETTVDRLLAGRTSIVIAHHLPTIRRCQNILILSEGRIVEEGSRAELEANPTSHFSRLLRTAKEGILA